MVKYIMLASVLSFLHTVKCLSVCINARVLMDGKTVSLYIKL